MINRFYFDTEFYGFGGEILSLALVHEDGDSLYLVLPDADLPKRDNHWVEENVLPILLDVPGHVIVTRRPLSQWGDLIAEFLYPNGEEQRRCQVICDWPDDIRYLLNLMITGEHKAVTMGLQTDFTVLRHIDVYPCDLEGVKRHNAWWDAMALRRFVQLAKT